VNKTIRTLKARKAAVLAAMQSMTSALVEANREPTAEEQTQFDANKLQLAQINGALEREQTIAQEMQGLDAAGTALEVPGATVITGGAPRVEADPKRGFSSFGDFAASVRKAESRMGFDDRLKIVAAAPTTFGNEAAGADGGFAVPPEFSQTIWTLSLGEDSLIPFCDNTPVRGNSMVFPKDETVPWGTDGIRAYWQAEAGAGTPTKPALGTSTMRLHKLMALVPVTDELLEDTDALNAYIPTKAAASIRWKTNEAILFGNGNGQPIGAMNSAAALTTAKDSGQATLTLSDSNIANMKRSLPPGSRRSALWLLNNDVEGALLTLKNASGYPLYVPFGGGIAAIQQSPWDGSADASDDNEPDGKLYGMPLYLSQHANTFSSLGDVLLLDLSYYRVITKNGEGIETATSMHLYFDADATAFRMLFRIDGMPKISKQISPAKGSNKMSPFVQLASR
jgi:HK97 family phage major capsid protein